MCNLVRFAHRFSLLILLLLALFSAPALSRPVQAQGTCSIDGTVYRDLDASGARGAPDEETGVEDIRVSAYNAAGDRVASATTTADGSYTLNGLQSGVDYRIEFTDLPDFLESGPFGSDSPTTVTFVNCDAGSPPTIDLGVMSPGEYCGDNPTVATTCFVVGSQFDRTEETVISFPYNAGSGFPVSISAFDQPSHSILARANQVGTTWGIAYQRETATIFVGAFLKRHTGLGPSGPGAIYAIDNAQNVTDFAILNAGTDPHPTTSGTPNNSPAWMQDSDSWAAVGKVGLGDLEMSDDGRTLWAVNLFDQSLTEISINVVNGVPVAGNQTIHDLSNRPDNCAPGDVRPFALKFQFDRIFVGVVCSAQSNGNSSNLWAYVYSLAPGTNNFREELRLSLNYDRRCTNSALSPACLAQQPADWNAWTDDFQYYGPDPDPRYQVAVYPQPMLTDIEFTDDKTMVLGFRDRFADQAANLTQRPFDPAGGTTDPADQLYLAISAGDILRACRNNIRSDWQIENNGSCAGVGPTAGANTNEGPGGGEFYFDDNLVDYHDEVSLGALAYLPGQPNIAATFFDPIPNAGAASFPDVQLNDAGVRWLDNTTGAYERAYRVYNGEQAPTDSRPFFGKANGLGDLELICPVQPLEIGNRVWFNDARDGIQNPGPFDFPVPDITVNLYYESDPNTVIATTMTDSAGEYYFNNANVADSLRPNTDYIIRLDNPVDYDVGGPLEKWFLTRRNAGSGQVADMSDSDARMEDTNNVGTDYPTIHMTTGDWGENNHTYDFGFAIEAVMEETPSVTPPDRTGTPETPVPTITAALNKSVNPPFAQIGDTVTWTLTVSNPGSTAYPNVVVTDNVPAGMTIVSVSASAGSVSYSGQTVTFTKDVLNPGETVTVTIVTTIDDGADVPLIFVNAATWGDRSASAQVVRASAQPATGIVPPVVIVLLLSIVAAAALAIVLTLRRRRRI